MIIYPYARSLYINCTTPFSGYVHVSACNARIIQWMCRVVYFKTYVRFDRRNKTYMHDLALRGNLSHMQYIYYVWVINQRKRKLKLWSWTSTMGNNSSIFAQFLIVSIFWSFKEKTFVKQSLGTVLEIVTKLLRFAHAWLRYTFWGSKV